MASHLVAWSPEVASSIVGEVRSLRAVFVAVGLLVPAPHENSRLRCGQRRGRRASVYADTAGTVAWLSYPTPGGGDLGLQADLPGAWAVGARRLSRPTFRGGRVPPGEAGGVCRSRTAALVVARGRAPWLRMDVRGSRVRASAVFVLDGRASSSEIADPTIGGYVAGREQRRML